MTMKHTSGPWRVGSLERDAVYPAAAVAPCIADCNALGRLPIDERQANANLIAQAPTMFKALEGLVEYLETISTEDGWRDVLPELRDYGDAKAALALARGDQLYQIQGAQ